jgi:hypothetical protein
MPRFRKNLRSKKMEVLPRTLTAKSNNHFRDKFHYPSNFLVDGATIEQHILDTDAGKQLS